MDFLRRLAWLAGIVVVITWMVRDPAGAGHFARSIGNAVTAGAAALGTLAANL
jgi:hypothetical protein